MHRFKLHCPTLASCGVCGLTGTAAFCCSICCCWFSRCCFSTAKGVGFEESAVAAVAAEAATASSAAKRAAATVALYQGLAFVHFSARPEPFLSLKLAETNRHTPQEVLTMS